MGVGVPKRALCGVILLTIYAVPDPGHLNRCQRCHGVGFGGGSGAPSFGGPTFDGDFEGYTLFDLENRIHTSMPRDQPGTTSRVQATDLVAFILSQMKAPPGRSELPADEPFLRLIRIEAPK